MNLKFLSSTYLFRGCAETELGAMLKCLGAYNKTYAKGETIFLTGEITEYLGLVLSGSVNIENDDLWGNKSILGQVRTGQIFAETYACIPGAHLMISVIATQKTQVLFLNTARLLQTCKSSCPHHHKLIQNLLQITAQKNLDLSKRILHTSPKSIRGRLISYFSEQALQNGSYQFTMSFNRQQLADYLGVDRSALSKELSKMQADGLLTYEKNTFILNQMPE